MSGLEDYRNSIDEIDQKITELFEQRMDVVLKVGEYKKKIICIYLIRIEKMKLLRRI